jgi:hypothetical protein
MLFDEQRQPIPIVAIIRDETERFQEGRQLLAKLAADERGD